MKHQIGIAIPTYNESDNIIPLLSKIKKTVPDAFVVIVDDSRPEENEKLKAAVLKSKFKNDKTINIISRFKKDGRGHAVIDGLKKLLENKDIYYFLEMDADLSHDPTEIPLFLETLEKENVDVVIGSRYLDQSKIVKWPLKRVIPSKIINAFINVWLGIKLSDYTNGFRLYKRDAIEFLSQIKLREKGFILLSETIYRLKTKGFKIGETPISFTDRKHGRSSAGLAEYKDSIIGILRIKILPISFRE